MRAAARSAVGARDERLIGQGRDLRVGLQKTQRPLYQYRKERNELLREQNRLSLSRKQGRKPSLTL